jgi:hypothetical protein
VNRLRDTVSGEAAEAYEKISRERVTLYTVGLLLGLLVAYLIVYVYSGRIANRFHRMTTFVAIMLFTGVSFYTVYPKSDYMLNHIKTKEEAKACLQENEDALYYRVCLGSNCSYSSCQCVLLEEDRMASDQASDHTAITLTQHHRRIVKPESSKEYIDFLEDKLNEDLGWYYWKKYVAAAFWSQVSMPINLVITLLTAVTTAQATSPSLLPDSAYRAISITTLMITVLNTFFRPHDKMTKNLELVKLWNGVGMKFEKAFYNDLDNEYEKQEDVDSAIAKYKSIQDDINSLRAQEGPDTMNFLTDLIHIVVMFSCLRRRQTWLDASKKDAADQKYDAAAQQTPLTQPLLTPLFTKVGLKKSEGPAPPSSQVPT